MHSCALVKKLRNYQKCSSRKKLRKIIDWLNIWRLNEQKSKIKTILTIVVKNVSIGQWILNALCSHVHLIYFVQIVISNYFKIDLLIRLRPRIRDGDWLLVNLFPKVLSLCNMLEKYSAIIQISELSVTKNISIQHVLIWWGSIIMK